MGDSNRIPSSGIPTNHGGVNRAKEVGLGSGEVSGILKKLSPSAKSQVEGKMTVAQKEVRNVVECIKPQYDVCGDKVDQKIDVIERSLMKMESALNDIQKATGATREDVVRDTLFPYYDKGMISPSEMVTVATNVQLSKRDNCGDHLDVMIDSFYDYLDQAPASDEVQGGLIGLATYYEAESLPPVTVEKKIGNGSFNSVYLTTDGKVYKPLPNAQQVSEGVGEALEIHAENPRFIERSVMTKELDDMLGFGVIVDTALARGEDEIGIEMDKIDAVNRFVKGWVNYDSDNLRTNDKATYDSIQALISISAWNADGTIDTDSTDPDLVDELQSFFGTEKIKRIPNPNIPGEFDIQFEEDVGVYDFYSEPEFRRKSVQLQLEDAISDHGDRHKDNYLVTCDDMGKVTGFFGIDNDTAFGSKIFPRDAIESAWSRNYGLSIVAYPRVVDTDMLDAVNGLDEEELESKLRQRLVDSEVDATLSRLDALKKYLNSGAVTVIQPDEWGSDRALQLLEAVQDDPKDPTKKIPSSYVGRDSKNTDNLPKIPLSAMSA